MLFRMGIVVAFILCACNSVEAGGWLGDYVKGANPSAGEDLDTSQRDMNRAVPDYQRSDTCYTASGSCDVEPALKNARCYCQFGSNVVFGTLQ
jgi:hypothetical protein